MAKTAAPRSRPPSSGGLSTEGIALSVALHVGVVGGFAILDLFDFFSPEPPPPLPVAVSVMTEEQLAALQRAAQDASLPDPTQIAAVTPEEAQDVELQPAEAEAPPEEIDEAELEPIAPETPPEVLPEPVEPEVLPEPEPELLPEPEPEPEVVEAVPQPDVPIIGPETVDTVEPDPVEPEVETEAEIAEPEPEEIVEPEPAETEVADLIPPPPPPAPKRPEPEQPPPQKTEEPETPADPLANLLQTVQNVAAQAQQQQARERERRQEAALPPAGAVTGPPLTSGEKRAIQAQVERRWVFQDGMAYPETMIVAVDVWLREDGTVQRLEILDKDRMRTDRFYRIAAEDARRAVLAASPLDLPEGKFESWRYIRFTFNPREMIGG